MIPRLSCTQNQSRGANSAVICSLHRNSSSAQLLFLASAAPSLALFQVTPGRTLSSSMTLVVFLIRSLFQFAPCCVSVCFFFWTAFHILDMIDSKWSRAVRFKSR